MGYYDEPKYGDQNNRTIVRSQQDFVKFCDKHIIEMQPEDRRNSAKYLAHIKKHWGAPSSYPAFVWTWVSPPAEEIGPTFPQTHLECETKAELEAKLAEF